VTVGSRRRLATKPLGHKAYGSIPHLPGSRLGVGDHHCHAGQAAICTTKVRDRHDEVFVQEKLDGSCVAVARVGSTFVALGRAGWPAESSKYLQHQLFADWVRKHEARFDILMDGERVVGEWLAQAHGTRYELPHEPFVAFDLMIGQIRAPQERFQRLLGNRFVTPRLICRGPISLEQVRAELERSGHGAQDPVEGAVWRVERRGNVDFLAKWVRPEKVDGCYLPEISGREALWNWRPQ
jgi:hypothetical protein